jgi:putative membrane protein
MPTPDLNMHHDDDGHLKPVDAAHIRSLTRPDDNLLKLYIIYAALSNILFPFSFLPLYFHFKTLRYRFDEEGVAVSYGIFWRKETYLTYARIQDIHVTRNIFERWLGIGSVEIQTAAGSASATESIVGVREFNQIRNYLYAHMRGHAPASGKEEPAGTEAPLETALAGIRDELQAIRLTMEGRGDV